MASLYTIKRSPFWYVQYLDKTGHRKNVSTGLRHDDPGDTAKARILRANLEAKEHAAGGNPESDGWAWVPAFIAASSNNANTLRRYTTAWEWISFFLVQAGLTHPSQVRFRHGQEFATFRSTYKKKSGKTASINTARQEAKIFSLIMTRAVQLELATGNPLVQMRLPKTDAPEKPALTPEEFRAILPALEAEPDWMRISFQIAMHTGCRLRETRLPLSCIDFERRTITFPSPKGGKKRAFTRPLPDELLPVLLPLRGQAFTLDFPFQPSRRWQQFFIKMKMEHLCFHCLRVTYITMLALSKDVPLSVAMRLVNHASETIHRIYQRLKVEDVQAYSAQLHVLAAPAPSGATPQNPPGTPSQPLAETQPISARPAPLRRTRRVPRPTP